MSSDFQLNDGTEWPSLMTNSQSAIAKQLYIPAITRSSAYYRLTGYFNSSMLKEVASVLDGFFKNEGSMKIVCSPHLHVDDLESNTLRERSYINGKKVKLKSDKKSEIKK